MILLLILFTMLSFLLGVLIANVLFPKTRESFLLLSTAFFLGNAATVTMTYVMAVIFSLLTDEPLVAGMAGVSLVCVLILWRFRTFVPGLLRETFQMKSLHVLLVGLIFLFSSWMMQKTFHGDAAGNLLVASNTVFDMGHNLSIIRSISWGDNIPFMSPFVAGAQHVYHFLFYFWVALWEYSGIPIGYAFNGISALSFAGLLLLLFSLSRLVFKKSDLLGMLVVLLAVTHSTLSAFLISPGSVWHLSQYPFAGPFDGSPISLLWTLNVFVNQRHLALAIGAVLLLYFAVYQLLSQKLLHPTRLVFISIFTGVLFLWHMVLAGVAVFLIVLLLLFNKRFKAAALFLGILLLVASSIAFPWLSEPLTQSNIQLFSGHAESPMTLVEIGTYFIYNFGISLITIPMGIWLAVKNKKYALLPFFILFIVAMASKFLTVFSLDQKVLNLWILVANMFSAYLLVTLWEKKTIVAKALVLFLVFLLTASGAVDLMVMKNDFQFPLTNSQTTPLINWMRISTPKNAVFVSYSDIVDPVTIAGRKNYYGYFHSLNSPDRSAAVRRMYEQPDIVTPVVDPHVGIHYMLVPKWVGENFSYTPNRQRLNELYSLVYENEAIGIYDMRIHLTKDQ